MRRLPVYLLIDVSGSMSGEPIHAVQNGMENLAAELRKNPYALETAWLSVITFGSDAKVDVELTELPDFQPPGLRAGGVTALGKGLKLLGNKISTEVKKTTADQKGDWKPLVFIMSDGGPTDDWRKGLEGFKKQKAGIVVACAAGKGADVSVLKEITPNVVKLDTPDEKSISEFFRWVSASVQVSSTKVESSGQEADDFGELPPPPKGIDLVKH
ncbi:VWA domain-containing protein [Marinilabiliaceae bacterium JC017]|nr:VWA domain-containing protein [Marinilabiliaceae bacterium JC017]